jgi:hypothetical protein
MRYEDLNIDDRLYVANLALNMFKHSEMTYSECYDSIVRNITKERDTLPIVRYCCKPHNH